ncbi:MAG: hypothetical protein AAF761_00725 [Pseudomonadota bacterium]
MPTVGFTAMYLPGGGADCLPLQSTSAAFYVVRWSKNQSKFGDINLTWSAKNTFTAPVFAPMGLDASQDAFLIRIKKTTAK